MALKDAWNALIGKSEPKEEPKTEVLSEQAHKEKTVMELINHEMFPVIDVTKTDLSRYKKLPLSGIAALGAAFSTLPAAARTIVETTTSVIPGNETFYRALNPKGVTGTLQGNALGINGNIMQVNSEGKNVVKGRLVFQEAGNLSMINTSTTLIPFNPTTMAIAAALMTIEQKLNTLQEGIEEILQFLKLEKQSRQRGNLDILAEIMEEYKQHCDNEKLCALRNHEVQTIKREAQQDILFYEEQIAADLKKQKFLHIAGDAQSLIKAVSYQFAEYQLACYLYAFSSYLDIMLQKNFDTLPVSNTIQKITNLSDRYRALYKECREQLASYQRNAIESHIVGTVGFLTKGLGAVIGSIPVIKDGPVDEALIGAGQSIEKFNDSLSEKQLESLDNLQDDRVRTFIEGLRAVDTLYNETNALLTDGDNLYVLEPSNMNA